MSRVMNPGGDHPSGLAADPQPPSILIETLAAADEAVAKHYAKVDAMGVDLEGDLGASGKLSLLQLSRPGAPTLIFDVLRCPAILGAGSCLRALLEDATVCKVVHDCRNDVRALWGQLRVAVANVFDTQVADRARLSVAAGGSAAGQPIAKQPRRGLNVVLQEVLGVQNTEKGSVKHRPGLWEKRPVPPHLLSYAAQDVRHLVLLREKQLEGMTERIKGTVETRCHQSVTDIIFATSGGAPAAKASVSSKRKKVAEAFFLHLETEGLLAECEDRVVFTAKFHEWKKKRGTLITGRFSPSEVLMALRASRKVLRIKQADPSIIVWVCRISSSAGAARASVTTRVRASRANAEADKRGVVVRPLPLEFSAIATPGHTVTKSLSVKNEGAVRTCVFVGVKFLNDSHGFSANVANVAVPYTIQPGATVNVVISCHPITMGVFRDVVELQFSVEGAEFSIGRYVEVQAGDRELHEATKPTAPYVRRKRAKAQGSGHNKADSEGDKLPGSTPHWLLEPSGQHEIPSQRRLDEIADEVQEIATELKESPDGVSIGSYCQLFGGALWLEEQQLQRDIREFDMIGVSLERGSSRCLRLRVPGLAEGRPSVLRGDKVKLREGGQLHHGYVHLVERDSIDINFNHKYFDNYIKGQKVDIEFVLPRTIPKLHHEGLVELRELKEEVFRGLLFPEIGATTPASIRHGADTVSLAPFDDPHGRPDSLNAEQLAAVRAILRGSLRPAPYIVFGPPGTGKSVTVVAAVACAMKLDLKVRVLVCAPSNAAADLLCARLSKHTPKASDLLRVMAFSRKAGDVEDAVRKHSLFNGHDKTHFRSATVDDLGVGNNGLPDGTGPRIVIATISTAAKLRFQLGLERGFFDILVVDEAGQAQEPEVVAPLAMLIDAAAGGQVVLAGDPKQLGPIIHSDRCKELGLGSSLLERLVRDRPLYARDLNTQRYTPDAITQLVKNYRSHPDILQLPNEMFYDNALEVCADEDQRNELSQWRHLPQAGCPLIFHGVEGKDEREGNSPSWFNRSEIEVVQDYVKKLLGERSNRGVGASEIGIITPYQKQVQKMKVMLKLLDPADYNGKDPREIKVGSVEQFQGDEKKVIIISTVRASREYVELDTKFSLGFVADPKRFNVAVTRAKALLIVTGHPGVLWADEQWKRHLQLCQVKGAVSKEGVPLPEAGLATGEPDAAAAQDAKNELHAAMDRLSLAEPSQQIAQRAQGIRREE